MKKVAFPLALSIAMGAAGAGEPMKCSADAPYKYRIAYSYIGGRNSPDEIGDGAGFWCLEREVKTERDWNWLQKKIEGNPKVTRITIMSAVPVTD